MPLTKEQKLAWLAVESNDIQCALILAESYAEEGDQQAIDAAAILSRQLATIQKLTDALTAQA